MNIFRINDPLTPEHGKLDRAYLRTCATYKLFKAGTIDKARAVELLAQRGVGSNVADIWARRFAHCRRFGYEI